RIVESDLGADCARGFVRRVVSDKSETSFAALRFTLCERSPAHGLYAEHIEESRRHLHRENALRLAIVARQITAAEVVG
ncbi:hypothetical protein ACQ7B2_17525, partial [Escherichia coli]